LTTSSSFGLARGGSSEKILKSLEATKRHD
jgi:hypothetical protein